MPRQRVDVAAAATVAHTFGQAHAFERLQLELGAFGAARRLTQRLVALAVGHHRRQRVVEQLGGLRGANVSAQPKDADDDDRTNGPSWTLNTGPN